MATRRTATGRQDGELDLPVCEADYLWPSVVRGLYTRQLGALAARSLWSLLCQYVHVMDQRSLQIIAGQPSYPILFVDKFTGAHPLPTLVGPSMTPLIPPHTAGGVRERAA
nr:hypothetical protein [Kibdelosporangium sp. MJ126-NF4]CTQ96925.1 hypothetical protein [Kibdelosporangium sp. MJ126-NF4]